jgi:TIR domain/Polymerase beta, Nucleotidyltransferase/NB-ARC domain
MSIDLQPQELERVKGILALHLPNPIPVLVFGSRGNGLGKAHRTSDIDLALITTERLSASVMTNLREAFAASDLPYSVDIVDWLATDKVFQQKILAGFTVLSPDFFISYTAPDLGWAQWLAYQLEDAGYSTVLQAWDFKGGNDFVERIDRALKFSRHTLAVLSNDYLNSAWCRAEKNASIAVDPLGDKQKFIGVKVAPCTLDGLLTGRVYIDLQGKGEQVAKQFFLAQIANALSTGRNKPDTSPAFPGVARDTAVPSVVRRINSKTNSTRFPSNPSLIDASHFVGRQAIYQDIQTALLDQSAKTNAPIVISGGAGYGKSTLALHLSQGVAFGFDAVCWVNADTETSLAKDYADLASRLGLGLPQGMPQPEQIKVVKQHLDQSSRVLLILDNAEDLKLIAPYLPATIGGVGSRALLTSRLQRWDGMKTFDLEVFSSDEAKAFWLQQFEGAAWLGQADEVRAADVLATELGYLPLAMRQAAAYMADVGLMPSAYLERWRKESNRFELMNQSNLADYPHSLAVALKLSFDKLREKSPAAFELLELCSIFAPDKVPLELLQIGLTKLTGKEAKRFEQIYPNLKKITSKSFSVLAWGELRRDLHRLSLARCNNDDLSWHRLSRDLMKLLSPALSARSKKHSWYIALSVLEKILSDNTPKAGGVSLFTICTRLAVHILTWYRAADLVLTIDSFKGMNMGALRNSLEMFQRRRAVAVILKDEMTQGFERLNIYKDALDLLAKTQIEVPEEIKKIHNQLKVMKLK